MTVQRIDWSSQPRIEGSEANPAAAPEEDLSERHGPISSLTIFNVDADVVCTGDSCFVPMNPLNNPLSNPLNEEG
jgi:hypothetical protein